MAEDTTLETLEQEGKTGTGGGSQTPPQNTDPDKLFRSGITRERKRITGDLTSELADYGVKPVLDGKGKLDLKQSLAALVKAGQPEAAAALENKYSSQLADLRARNEKLEDDLQKTRIIAVVREKISGLNPANLDDSVEIFLKSYNIKPDDETGQLGVFDFSGTPMHDKITAVPYTVETIAMKFAEEKPWLFTKPSANALAGLGSMKGSPANRAGEDLSRRYMDALKTGNKELAKQLKLQMQDSVHALIAEREG